MGKEKADAKADAKTAEAGKAASAKVEQRILRIGKKEFDVSTPEGLLHAQAWAEATSSLIGTQGQEVGDLRKETAKLRRVAQEVELLEDDRKLLTEVAGLRENGEHLKADELLVKHSKRTSMKARAGLEAERDNDKTWRQYVSSRKELLKYFDEDEVRAISERKFGEALYDTTEAFSLLDTYWKPKLTALKAETKGEELEDGVTVQTGRGASGGGGDAEPDERPKVDLNSILDANSIYKPRT